MSALQIAADKPYGIGCYARVGGIKMGVVYYGMKRNCAAFKRFEAQQCVVDASERTIGD